VETLAASGVPGTVLASLRRGRPERETLLQACAGAYAAGLDPDWPTPLATRCGYNQNDGGAKRPGLAGAARLWPTATRQDSAQSGAAAYSTESGRHPGTTLTDAASGLWTSMFPTLGVCECENVLGTCLGFKKNVGYAKRQHLRLPCSRAGDHHDRALYCIDSFLLSSVQSTVCMTKFGS
jgi:hypothetical protein